MSTCINKYVRDEIFRKRLVGGIALILVSFKRKGQDQVAPGRQEDMLQVVDSSEPTHSVDIIIFKPYSITRLEIPPYSWAFEWLLS